MTEIPKLLDEFIWIARQGTQMGSGDDLFYELQVEEYINKQRAFWIHNVIPHFMELGAEQERKEFKARDSALAKQSGLVLLMLTLPFNHWPRVAQDEYSSWAKLERSKPMASIQYFIIDKLTEIEVALRGESK